MQVTIRTVSAPTGPALARAEARAKLGGFPYLRLVTFTDDPQLRDYVFQSTSR